MTQRCKEHDKVVSVGGLHVVGTERHDSRRIDNQLRGRSGRQGDPGSSRFYVSLEDDLMRIFGGDKIAGIMTMLKIPEEEAIEHSMVSKALESAQVKVEGFYFDMRKRVVDYDDVMNKHRQVIYQLRNKLLSDADNNPEDIKRRVLDLVNEEVELLVNSRITEGLTVKEIDAIVKEFITIIPFDDASQKQLVKELGKTKNPESIINALKDIAKDTYESREKSIGAPTTREIEKYVYLTTLDEKWMDHLDHMESLREGIWLRGDKNTVLAEYKKEAFSLFDDLIQMIESTIANRIFRVQVRPPQTSSIDLSRAQTIKEDVNESLTKEVADAAVPGNMPTGVTSRQTPTSTQGSLTDLAAALKTAKGGSKPTPGNKHAKIGRHDPCPCGSGLKYKKCGLINAPEHRG